MKTLETKECIQCNIIKPLTEFEKNRRKCKACLTLQRQEIKNRKKLSENENIDADAEGIPETIKLKEEVKKEESKPKTDIKIDDSMEKNIKFFLNISFDVIASRMGEHWSLTDKESTNIAKPLNKMLNKLKYVDSISKNMDVINLTSALIGVFTPRIIVTSQLNKEKKGKINNGGNRTNKNGNGKNKPSNSIRNDTDTEHTETKIKNDVGGVSADIEAELFNEKLIESIL